MSQDLNGVSRTPLQDYLHSGEDSRLQRQLAALSFLPPPTLSEAHSSRPMSTSNVGTSLLLSSRDYSLGSSNLSHDLPALSNEASSRSSTDSVNASLGADLVEGYPLLDIGHDGVLITPPPPPMSMLRCPFDFLPCILTFATFEAWFLHSLTHFRGLTPPTKTKCCFCDEVFEHLDGRVCWEQRMVHVHRHGHNIARASPNFQLIQYLFSKKLVSNDVYKILRGGGESSTGIAYTSTSSAYTSTSSSGRHRRRQQ